MNDGYPTDYALLESQATALLADETDALANAANFVGLLFDSIPAINWVGIYVLRGDELVLGPFQGRPACVRIALGSGVCGVAAKARKTLRVADVNKFAGHIACDPVSRAEFVVPLISGDRLLGVLDIDSPLEGRFSHADERGIESLCERFVGCIETNGIRTPDFI